MTVIEDPTCPPHESRFCDELCAFGIGYLKQGPFSFEEYKADVLEALTCPCLRDELRETLYLLADWGHKRRSKRVSNGIKGELLAIRRADFAKQRPDLALALIDRDGYECRGCHAKEALTIDHIWPVSRGGTDDLENLQWLCKSCNSKKSAKT